MQAAQTKDQIREFVTKIAVRKGVASVADGDSLISAGVLDSMAIFRLVSFLEETFGVAVDDEEIAAENFRSIDAIQDFVAAKLKSS